MATELPALPQNLVTGLLEIVQALDRHGIRYALIGGLATSYRSRPRFTQDIDLMLEIPQVTLPGLLDDLHARGFTFEMEPTIRRWIREHMVVISFRNVRVDWLKPLIDCYKHVLENATTESWLGAKIQVASPESLILTKLIAFRTQDQLDIENLLEANRGLLDLELIRREWQTVGESDDIRMKRFGEMLTQFYSPPAPS